MAITKRKRLSVEALSAVARAIMVSNQAKRNEMSTSRVQSGWIKRNGIERIHAAVYKHIKHIK